MGKLMSASEAKKVASTNTDRITKKEAVEKEKHRKAGVLAAANARKNFIKEFDQNIANSIKNATEYGDNSTKVYLASGESDEDRALAAFSKHKYLPEIKAAMARLRRAGYKVAQELGCSSHETHHESTVPDYTYYRYHCYILIEW